VKLTSILLIFSIVSLSCNNKYSKKDHKWTTKLAEGLYVERFTIYGSGAFGTDIVTVYLTDSTYFNQFIGSFDEGNEYFQYKINGDSILVRKFMDKDANIENKKPIEEKLLLLSKLKQLNNFDVK